MPVLNKSSNFWTICTQALSDLVYLRLCLCVVSKGIRDLPLPPTSNDDLMLEEPDSVDTATPSTAAFRSRPKILARCGILEKNKHAWGKQYM